MVCSFLGHSDTPYSIYPELCYEIEKLILSRNITQFLVGTHGAFDRMALKALRQMKGKYPHISYSVVLAYMPKEKMEYETYHYAETLLPKGIEMVPKRFEISWQNKWMVRESHVIICYIIRTWGGAVQFVKYAKNQGKEIINIGEELRR